MINPSNLPAGCTLNTNNTGCEWDANTKKVKIYYTVDFTTPVWSPAERRKKGEIQKGHVLRFWNCTDPVVQSGRVLSNSSPFILSTRDKGEGMKIPILKTPQCVTFPIKKLLREFFICAAIYRGANNHIRGVNPVVNNAPHQMKLKMLMVGLTSSVSLCLQLWWWCWSVLLDYSLLSGNNIAAT